MHEEVEESCMFFPDENCLVQVKMKDFMALDKVEPKDPSEALKFAHAATKVLGASSAMILQALAAFCASCPHKSRWTYNKYAPKPVPSEIPVLKASGASIQTSPELFEAFEEHRKEGESMSEFINRIITKKWTP